ncbi:MAG TPA: Gfo/Idh/MocA family oxidoreductase [Terriglobia bacterium]|nr:Gfo/Idh/MocA family oxidoreductase [Terriglobia bacterium]
MEQTGKDGVHIGIIGTGWWALKNHIPVLQSRKDVKIASVCGLGRDGLLKIQKDFGIGFATEDYRELLARDNLDGVVISSPHPCHYDHASAALGRGVHVFCEKPMVLHAAEARRLAALTASGKRHFLIAYGWNYTPLAIEARDLILKGKVGKIEHVQCHMGSATRDLFSGEEFWFSQKDTVKPDPRTWSDPAGGGGFANGQLTHALALLFYITGLQPQEVFAYMTSSKTGADLTDAISCRFKNGATGMLGGAGTMPARSTYQIDIRIFGSEGMLLLDIERPRLELYRHDGESVLRAGIHEPGEYSCVEPPHAFIDLIQGKQVENRSPAELGVSVVELLEAAFRSAHSGKSQAVVGL